jgi:hypothetical protein
VAVQEPESDGKSRKLQGRILVIAIVVLMALWIYAVVRYLI